MNHRALIRVTAQLALLAIIGLSLPLWRTAALAQGVRDPQAEQFVQTQGQRVISLLTDHSGDVTQSDARFHEAINELADVPKITNFVLGKYARTITPDQRQRFASAFRAYAEKVYQQRIGAFGAETLTVTGSLVRGPGDVVVNSLISGGRLKEPLPVAWRVLGGGAARKAVDVQVNGVWLAITQQQDFVSTIDNAGGNIEVLIAKLQQDVQRSGPSH